MYDTKYVGISMKKPRRENDVDITIDESLSQ
jgi:hypothetical protein